MASQTTQDPDAEVLQLISDGNTAGALRRLMQRYGTEVYRYCSKALGDPALAEDVRQQVFIDAFRDLPGFVGRSRLRTWLFGIARHRVLDTLRTRRRSDARTLDGELAEVAAVGDPRPSAADSLALRQVLEASLADLGEDARTTVLLRFHAGYSFDEIAQICGASASAHHARVMRALPQLRQGIQSRIDSSGRAHRERERVRRAD